MTHPISPKPASPKTAEDANCFALEVERDLRDVEIIIEIVNIEPPEPEVGFRGTVEIEAYSSDGTSFTLTPSEYERALNTAIANLERDDEAFENERMDR